MPGGRRVGRKRQRGHLGVWDPTGGEAREGSGLPVEKGAEEVRALGREAGGEVREVPPEELGTALETCEAVWIDLLRPRARSEEILRDVLCLDPLTVEDCLAPLRMPKIDVFPERGAFISAFAARLERDGRARLRAVEVDLVAGENYLVTVRDGPLAEVSERLRGAIRSPAVRDGGPGAGLAYEALDALVDGHLPALVSAATAAEDLEEALDPANERASVDVLEDLISLRRDLQAFRRLAVAQQDVLRRLGRSLRGLRDYLSDVADNQREALDMAEATRDYVDGAAEAYRIRRDERSELGIRRLTVLAAVIGPPTLLAGIYGMNFAYLPGAGDMPGAGEAWAFWIFIAVQVAFVAGAVGYLRRSGLL